MKSLVKSYILVGPVHMCPLMCLVPLPLFNQFIMLSGLRGPKAAAPQSDADD